MKDALRAVSVLAVVAACCVESRAQAAWSLDETLTSRYGMDAVYDPVRGHTLCFGGDDGRLQHDTWTWDGDAWTRLTPAHHPIGDTRSRMVWDSVRDRAVLVATRTGQPVETWAWDGTDWTQLATSGAPAPTARFDLAFDPLRDRVVYWGEGGTQQSALWEFDGADDSWTQIPQSQPWPQWFGASPAIAFDPDAGSTAYYQRGGTSGMWRWNGVSWSLDAGPSFSGPAAPELVHDPIGHRMLLVGGLTTAPVLTPPPPPSPTLYEWNPATNAWDNLLTGGPATSDHAVAFDVARGELVVVGGQWRGMSADSSVWVLRDGAWLRRTHAPPPGRREATFAHDRAGERLFLFGGRTNTNTQLGDTWVRTDGEWRAIPWIPPLFSWLDTAPGDRRDTRLIYDEARDELLLIGGEGDFPFFRLIGDAWAEIDVPTPPYRDDPAVAYDRLRERVVLFGGDGVQTYGDTWTWDGSAWTQLQPSLSPSPRAAAAMTYDPARDRIVLVGGYIFTGGQGDTWEFDGVDWQLVSTSGPVGLFEDGLTYDDVRQVVVAQNRVYQQPPETWQWDGTTWQRLPTTSNPPYGAHFIGTENGVEAFGGFYGSDTSSEHWVLATPSPARADAFGPQGPSTNGPLALRADDALPWLGTTFRVILETIPQISLPGLWGGFTNSEQPGSPLPVALDFLGFPGQQLLISLEGSWPALNVGDGHARADIEIPDTAALIGFVLHLQGFVYDPLAGALIGSNGLTMTIGAR